jgi:hypothetical protein
LRGLNPRIHVFISRALGTRQIVSGAGICAIGTNRGVAFDTGIPAGVPDAGAGGSPTVPNHR